MAFKMIPLAFLVVLYLLARNVADATIGMNWGRQNAQRLLPSNVVDLMLQNGIKQARVFTSEVDLLQAFSGSGIGLTINIGSAIQIKTYDGSGNWVEKRQKYFTDSNVRQIFIADFVFSLALYNKAIINDAIEALQSLQKAVNDAGYENKIQVTIPQNKGVLKMNRTSLRPSEAEFADEIKQEMAATLRILEQNEAPFVFSLNPIDDVQDLGVDLNFAIPDNKSTLVVKDVNGAVYTNVFELMYDSFIWALIKLNATSIKVVVGQVGWPTDGYTGANATMAEQFYKRLLPLVMSNKGTPMRPGAPIDIFIQSITDENVMPYYDALSSFTRHWGIYRSNGMPKYKMDLSGQGRDIYPEEAKGIMRMPQRWCVVNEGWSDVAKMRKQKEIACSRADCTALATGGTCSHLSFEQNVSYAFNMYFQFQYQNETECNFEGLGHVTVDNPSTSECIFPVEVVRADQPNYAISSAGIRLNERPLINSAIVMFLLSILRTHVSKLMN